MRRDPFPAVLLVVLAAAPLPAQERGKGPQNQVSVFGRVHSLVGEGVPVAEVWVTGEDGKVLGRTVADGDGIFQLHRLPAASLRLHARAAGMVEGWLPLGSVGQHRAAAIVLEDGDPVRGTVTRRDGTPVAGATVLVHAAHLLGAPFAWQQETVTDAKGAWSLAAAPLRDLVVRAWAPGFKLTDTMVSRRDGADVTAVLDGPTEPRRVRVSGMAEGQRVTVYCKSGRSGFYSSLPAVLREVAVQQDGTAQLWPLPQPHEVALTAPGFKSYPVFIPCAPDVRADLEFALTALPPDVATPSTRIAGRLVDELGRPLPGVAVLSRVDGRSADPVATGADGGFVLDVAVRAKVLFQLGLVPGPWRLGDVRAELENDGVTWLTIAADPTAETKLHATRAGAIRGVPRSPAGTPFAAAQVVVKRLDEHGKPIGGTRQIVWASDAAGRVDLPGLPAGGYEVTVGDGAGVEGTVRIEVPAGGEATLEKLSFGPSGIVTGVVRDDDGRPAGGVQVAVGPEEPGLARARRMPAALAARVMSGVQPVFTDRLGRFRIGGLAPGDWQVLEVRSPVQKARVVAATAKFTVEAGKVSSVELDVER